MIRLGCWELDGGCGFGVCFWVWGLWRLGGGLAARFGSDWLGAHINKRALGVRGS